MRNKAVLLRGAVESRTHILVADALQTFSHKFDQQQLFILLRLLGTSVGNFLLTGIPVPFESLPLHHREVALSRLRDSPLPDIRAAYQNFKRLTGNIFNAYAERGRLNPSWSYLQYRPDETVNGLPRPLQMRGDDEDTTLRRKVRYESVLQELGDRSSTESDVDVIDIDVVVIGSGAGGGTIASQLVLAGLNVLVLEKGGYFRADDFRAWRESEAMQHVYERSGLCTSADGNIVVLAGSCVGGGSTVNWSASFRTPQHVREEWVRAGLTDFREGGAFDDSLNAVHGLINVNKQCSHRTREEEAAVLCSDAKPSFAVNQNNQLLWEGAQKLGFTPESIPRNVKECVDCGHCTHGCAYESKQSTITAMMEPLLMRPTTSTIPRGYLHIIPDCHVERILYDLHKQGSDEEEGVEYGEHKPTKRARGVEAVATLYPESDLKASSRATDGDARKLNRPQPIGTRKLRVNAKIVICSAGAIHTPAVLLRSGFKHPQIGKNITLHPVLGAGGLFPRDVDTGLGSGVSMGVVVRSPPITVNTTVLNGVVSSESRGVNYDEEQAHAVAIETPPVHPGLLGLMLPWQSGKQFKMSCLGWRNFAIFIGIARDRSQSSNCVAANAQGQPVINYKLVQKDSGMLLAGFEVTLRMLYAAGASLVFAGHENFPWFIKTPESESVDSSTLEKENSVRFEAFLSSVRREGVQQSKTQIFSAHQMSTCRMAVSPRDGCTRPSGELFECSRLYLADASILPTSLGINPMVTIESFAHLVAGKVLQRVTRGTGGDEAQLRDRLKAVQKAQNKTQW
eukprot:gene25563-32033_t